MRPRVRKVIRDLASDPLKSLLLVAAIAIGVFGVGTVLGAYAVLNREIDRNYEGTRPAHATIVVDHGLSSSIVASAEGIPGVAEAERRATVTGRIQVGRSWLRVLIFAVDDFDRMRAGAFTRVSGAWPPPAGTLLLERSALELVQAGEGETVDIKLPDDPLTKLVISGVVHDPSLAPARQEQTVYAYLSPETLRLLGGDGAMDQLKIRTTAATMSDVTRIASAAASLLEEGGYRVHEIQIPPLGRHPHATQMNAILALLMVFASLVLLLSGVLVTSSVSVMMVRQVREIGVMKTLGAATNQIAGMYFFMISVLAAVGTVVAVPLSGVAAGAYADLVGGLLNFVIFDHCVPFWVQIVQAGAGLLIPLAVASSSVLRGSRVTIREAITDYGVKPNAAGVGRWGQVVAARIPGSTATISVRNLLRNRSRLVIALILLGAAGAMFTSALNLSQAWDRNLDKVMQQRLFDVEVRFARAVDIGPLAARVQQLDGVVTVEPWDSVPTSLAGGGNFDISHVYPDKGHGSFSLMGVPDDTRLIALPMLAGRWLARGDTDGVVINHAVAAQVPGARPGDEILLSIEGVPTKWRLAGIVEEDFGGLKAYVSASAFARVTGSAGKHNVLRVQLASRDDAVAGARLGKIDDLLLREGAPVSVTLPTNVFRNAVAEHMGILVGILLAMGAMMGMVGLLGLMSTVSMNVLERTRELGVMRAVGATPRRIFRLLVVEGLAIGLLSLPLGFLAALPISYAVGDVVGRMSFLMPLPLSVSLPALAVWVGILVFGSIGATGLPAWKAARLAVREALAYE